MLNKIKDIALATLAIAGLVVLFSFAASHKPDNAMHAPDIRIVSRSGNYFINNSSIEDILHVNKQTAEDHTNRKQTLDQLNKTISGIPFTGHVKTYRTVSGRLGIEIALRNPLIRVINNKNESFYIDENGYMFPLSDLHTARVMIASGDISTRLSEGRSITGAHAEDEDCEAAKMNGLFETAKFIHGDDFWRAFIDHIYVLPNGKLELIPKNGYHTIEFGYPELIAEKFKKLKIFYVNALTRKGWHHYNRINLEYNNQIICSK